MPRPFRDTFVGRVLWFLRGIIFYGTVDWKRASDGLKPPRLSRREREQWRPPRDLSAIKPREKPRAKLGAEGEAEAEEPPPAPVPKGFVKVSSESAPVGATPPEPPPATQENGEVVRKKRRRVRLQTSHSVLDSFGGPSLGSKGLLDRFFKKKG